MVVRVKTSFCGALCGTRGQVMEVTDEQAQDLIQAGYVVAVADVKPAEELKDAEALEEKPETADSSPDTVAVETAEEPEAEEPTKPAKRSRKK